MMAHVLTILLDISNKVGVMNHLLAGGVYASIYKSQVKQKKSQL